MYFNECISWRIFQRELFIHKQRTIYILEYSFVLFDWNFDKKRNRKIANA